MFLVLCSVDKNIKIVALNVVIEIQMSTFLFIFVDFKLLLSFHLFKKIKCPRFYKF